MMPTAKKTAAKIPPAPTAGEMKVFHERIDSYVAYLDPDGLRHLVEVWAKANLKNTRYVSLHGTSATRNTADFAVFESIHLARDLNPAPAPGEPEPGHFVHAHHEAVAPTPPPRPVWPETPFAEPHQAVVEHVHGLIEPVLTQGGLLFGEDSHWTASVDITSSTEAAVHYQHKGHLVSLHFSFPPAPDYSRRAAVDAGDDEAAPPPAPKSKAKPAAKPGA